MSKERTQELKEYYSLMPHEEGGFFKEVYTSSFNSEGRAYAGSIYYLLEKDQVSRFRVLEYDEVWFFHEGCGMKLTVIDGNEVKEYYLGNDIDDHEQPMLLIKAGEIFAVENIDHHDYSFVSCLTCPAYEPSGFRTVHQKEIRKICDDPRIVALAYPDKEEE